MVSTREEHNKLKPKPGFTTASVPEVDPVLLALTLNHTHSPCVRVRPSTPQPLNSPQPPLTPHISRVCSTLVILI